MSNWKAVGSISLMSICIVTAFNDVWEAEGQISLANKRAYAARHGYEVRCYRDVFDPCRYASWGKLVAIDRAFDEGFDAVFWTDADSLITNYSIKLEDLISDKALTMPETWGGAVTTGNFFVKDGLEVNDLFLRILWKEEKWFAQADWEESALNELIKAHPQVGERLIQKVPMRRLNSVPFSNEWDIHYPEPFRAAQWESGDFIIHFLRFGKHRVEAMQAFKP
jgi:mannan polymerase II complex MNN10 subunit